MSVDFWDGYHNPKVSELPLVNNVPLLITIWSIFFIFIFCLSRLMKSRPAYELEPLMLICDGLSFGSYGAAFAVAGYLTNFGLGNFLRCQLEHNYLVEEALYLFAYAFALFRHFELIYPVIMILRKKDNQRPMLVALNMSANVAVLVMGMHHYAKDVALLYPILEAFKLFLRSGYYALTVPATSKGVKKLKKLILFVFLCCQLLIMVQLLINIIRGCRFCKVVIFSGGLITLIEMLWTFKLLLRETSAKKSD